MSLKCRTQMLEGDWLNEPSESPKLMALSSTVSITIALRDGFHVCATKGGQSTWWRMVRHDAAQSWGSGNWDGPYARIPQQWDMSYMWEATKQKPVTINVGPPSGGATVLGWTDPAEMQEIAISQPPLVGVYSVSSPLLPEPRSVSPREALDILLRGGIVAQGGLEGCRWLVLGGILHSYWLGNDPQISRTRNLETWTDEPGDFSAVTYIVIREPCSLPPTVELNHLVAEIALPLDWRPIPSYHIGDWLRRGVLVREVSPTGETDIFRLHGSTYEIFYRDDWHPVGNPVFDPTHRYEIPRDSDVT